MAGLSPGFKAIVIGASGGIGNATANRLEADPDCGIVIRLSRSGSPALDLLDEASIAAAAAELRDRHGTFDLLFDATGALEIDGTGPEKTIKAIDPNVMARQFAINAIGPALLLKHFAPLLPRDRWSAFATLSARVGSIGDNRLGGWISYRSAKAALNQIVRTAAIEIRRTHPQAVVAALHPGTVRTRLSQEFTGDRIVFEPDEAAEKLLSTIFGLRNEDSGGFFAYDRQSIAW